MSKTLDASAQRTLAGWLATALYADGVEIVSANKLAGGAVQENWGLELEVTGGPQDGRRRWVLRCDPPTSIPASLSREDEFRIVQAAHGAGVKSPEPIVSCTDRSVIGTAFYLMSWAQGQAQARKIVRDPAIEEFGPSLAQTLAQELAMLHAITPPHEPLGFLPMPDGTPAEDRIAWCLDALDRLDEPRPACEYALVWLKETAPSTPELVFCHGDFRTGNYVVKDGKLCAILDWEFAGWSDPHEDLGWFCARCWRFGAYDREAGGIAAREIFLAAYEAASGRAVDRAHVHYWEVMCATRWGITSLHQERRHLTGGEPSLELGLTGFMAAEMELDILKQIGRLSGSGGVD